MTHSAHAPDPKRWSLICLCAQWCGACREYKAVWQRVAAAHPEADFRWIDIEDEAAAIGDYDVDDFPTVLVTDGSRVRFCGPLEPHARTLTHLLRSLQASEPAAAAAADPEARALALSLGLLR